MGARTLVRALSPTVSIEERWGNTHGEAIIRGSGLIFVRDISNSGKHYCRVLEVENGKITKTIEENPGDRYCPLCEKYWGEQ